MKRYIVFLFLFIFFISCSSSTRNKEENLEKNSKEAPKGDFLNTGYKYEKLNLKELYSENQKDFLDKIDLGKIKNLENSLLYVKEGEEVFTYIKRNPFEVYGLLLKKGKKRTLEDEILFLRLSLELNKGKIKNILKNLNGGNLLFGDIKEVYFLLSRFDLTDEVFDFLDFEINKLLKNKKKFNKENEKIFLALIDFFNETKKFSLSEKDNLKYFETYFKTDIFNKKINDKYIDSLIDAENYKKAESFILNLLSKTEQNKSYNKSDLFLKLTKIYNKNKEYEKIKKLYLENASLPEDKNLFFEYIKYLKRKKTWKREFTKIVNEYKNSKDIKNFYRYYFALKFNSEDTEGILKDFYFYALKNYDEVTTKKLSKLLIDEGLYDEAYNLLNDALINHENSKYLDDYLIDIEIALERKVYKNALFSSHYFFSVPDILGGLLSLIQNQYRDNDFLLTLNDYQSVKDRIDDISYLYENFKDKFKDKNKLIVFSKNYFWFLKNYNKKEKLFTLINELKKINKDDIKFNIFLLKTEKDYSNNRKKSILNEKIYELYLDLLSSLKDKNEFNETLKELLSFINEFSLSEAIKKSYDLIRKYPKSEIVYEKLLSLLESYRKYSQKEDIYEKALMNFNKKTWADKYARFLIRIRKNDKMLKLNEKLLEILNKEEYQDYILSVFPYKSYSSYESPYNKLYERIYKDALKKYPFNKKIVDKLLNFYDDFKYSYRYKSRKAEENYKLLLFRYVNIFNDYYDKFFADKDIKKELNDDKKLLEIFSKNKKSISELKYLARAYEYKNEFEKAVKCYSLLSKYYVNDEKIIYKTALLYKSLASSFYIKDDNFLKEAEKLYQRLTFLYRNKSKYYISLAELYYQLNKTQKAVKNLFRALEYQKGDKYKYIDIANVFYDYYDYDNALKTIYIYRERKNDKSTLIPFVGRLFELKNEYPEALNEYFKALSDVKIESYKSEKRIISLWNKDDLKDVITLKVEESFESAIKNDKLFYRYVNFLISANRKDLLKRLYTIAYEDSENIEVLKSLYNIFKESGDNRLESLLKKMEVLDKSDRIYEYLISFYKKNNNITEVINYYEKLLLNNEFENDKYYYINIIEEYVSFLLLNKRYKEAVGKYSELIKLLKDESDILKYKLKLAKIYKIINSEKYISELLNLDKNYAFNEKIENLIVLYYEKNKNYNNIKNYLLNKIKNVRKNGLSYFRKKELAEKYRRSLIEKSIDFKKYLEALNVYIDMLNRDPLNKQLVKEVYNFSKLNSLNKKLFEYYEKLTEKSYKNYKYMFLNAYLFDLNGNYQKSFEFYKKAEKLEPQNINIKIALSDELIKLGKYGDAYFILDKIYKNNQDKNNDFNLKRKIFKILILIGNRKKVADFAYNLASEKQNISFVADTLYKYSQYELARQYYLKLIDTDINSYYYVNEDILYRFAMTYILKGEGKELLDEVFSYLDKVDLSYSDLYKSKAVKRSFLRIVMDYIPDNISYFSPNEIKNMNEFLRVSTPKYDKYKAEYFRKIGMPDEYFEKLPKSYLKNTMRNYYRDRLNYREILRKGLYKDYDYSGRERVEKNRIKKAFLTYVWKDKKEAERILKSIVLFNNKNNFATDVFIEYLRKNNKEEYRNLAGNKYVFRNILRNYLKNSQKDLALKLIDAQDKSLKWKLKEKIGVYDALKIYNKDGINLYNKLLSLNLKIKDELKNNSFLVTEGEWDLFLEAYINYLSKAKESERISEYIDNIVETAPKTLSSYIKIADIYIKNEDYNNALKYLTYALKIKRSNQLNVKLYEVYYKKGEKSGLKKIENEIIETGTINDYYSFYNILKKYNALNINFINAYKDILYKNYKLYGYYKLKKYLEPLMKYLSKKSIDEIIEFTDKLKEGSDEVYKDFLNNYSLDKNSKLKIIDKLINYYKGEYDVYPRKTWVLTKVEYLILLKKYKYALKTLIKYKELFKYEDKNKYEFYLFKLNILSGNFDNAKELFLNSKYTSEYNTDKYCDFIFENGLAKRFFKDFWGQIKDNKGISVENFLKIIDVYDDLESKVLYLLNSRKFTIADYGILEDFAARKKLLNLFNLMVQKEYEEYYSGYSVINFNYYDERYYDYILNMVKSGKTEELKKVLNLRMLSIKEIRKIEGILKRYSVELLNLLNKNSEIKNNDVYYIKALLNFFSGKEKKALEFVNKIDVSKDFKYKFILPYLKVRILYKLKKIDNPYIIFEAVRYFPYSNNLKFILFDYYKNKGETEKAAFVLGDMGLYIYYVFDNLTKKYLNNFAFYPSYGDYEGDYYEYYMPQNIAKRIFNRKVVIYDYIDNFVSKFSKDKQMEILSFLYDIYQKNKNEKKFGLFVLYAYSKVDKGFENEYKELLKEIVDK